MEEKQTGPAQTVGKESLGTIREAIQRICELSMSPWIKRSFPNHRPSFSETASRHFRSSLQTAKESQEVIETPQEKRIGFK